MFSGHLDLMEMSSEAERCQIWLHMVPSNRVKTTSPEPPLPFCVAMLFSVFVKSFLTLITVNRSGTKTLILLWSFHPYQSCSSLCSLDHFISVHYGWGTRLTKLQHCAPAVVVNTLKLKLRLCAGTSKTWCHFQASDVSAHSLRASQGVI